MASPLRSSRKLKSTRTVSKTRERKNSPSKIQLDIKFESEESAYSDPVNHSQTIVPGVIFHRRDRQNLSPQAQQLFDSQIAFEDPAERSWLLENIRSTTILIKIHDSIYTINGNYIFKENQPCILCLHGFGQIGNWANWIKLAYPLSERGRYSVIFVDLPGFGQSSGRSLDQTSWKRHGPEIIVTILSSFQLRRSISVVARCGGAATIVRTINRYPQWFRGRHLVFINSVIGDFGETKVGDFEANISIFNIHIVVYWVPDKDHTKQCVAYKRWNKLRTKKFENLKLIDLEPTKQTMIRFYPKVNVIKISRCSSRNQAYVYKLSDEYIQDIIDILNKN